MKRLALFLLGFTLFVFAEGTKTWQQSSFEEFSRGTSKGIAVRSDGSLELAPAFKSIHTSPATYIWSMTADAAGNIYVGTGSPARVYRITPEGKATVIFQPAELQVQAVALDAKGVIYAATSPDGKVYKIEAGKKPAKDANEVLPGKPEPGAKEQGAPDKSEPPKETDKTPVDASYASSVFFDPKTKYIWGLAFDPDGRLYVATGDRGEIFRVNKDGSNALFFKSDEAHIRSLLVHTDGNVIAGSDGSGLVYRISPAGEGFVLFSASKKEITALAVDKAGNIYAAGVGEKRTGTTTAVSPILPQPQLGPAPAPVPGGPVLPMQGPSPFFPSFSPTGGSEVYMIAADGSPRRLWNSRDDIIYALAFDAHGRLLAGSGNKGRLLAIANNGEYVDLLKASANQITAFAPAPGGTLYLATSNLGKVFTLGAVSTEEGIFESEVFDARIFSKWGRVEVEGSGNFEIYGRSGNVDNPDRNWSPWKKVMLDQDSAIDAPAARFIQWKVVVPPRSHAQVRSVKLNYRPKNVAPVIDDIAVQTGARFTTGPSAGPRPATETIMVSVGSQPPASTFSVPQPPRTESPIPAQKDRSFIAVRWAVRDDNDDQLTYSVYYRGDGETKWKLLKDKITDKFYSWDSGLLPDGGYTLRVVASDAPSNAPDDFLADSKESARFEVDNTAPRIDGLNAKMEGTELHINFSATDTFSPIQRAEFSVDAGEWQFVEPVGQLSDAKVETYDFNVTAPAVANASARPGSDSAGKSKRKAARDAATDRPGAGDSGDAAPEVAELSNEHVVVVRVFDRFDNVSTAKIVVK